MNQPTEHVIPRGKLLVLGAAMDRVALRLKDQIDMPVEPNFAVGSMTAIVEHHRRLHPDLLARLSGRVDGVNEIVRDADTGDIDVRRAVGRFEATLEEMLGAYHEVRRLAATGNDIEARDLLAAMHKHSLREIHAWLTSLAVAIAEPLDTPQAQDQPAGGPAELSLVLTASTPRELERLGMWLRRRTEQATAPSQGSGLLASVGAKMKGWKIGDRFVGSR